MNNTVLPSICPVCSYLLEWSKTKVDLFCYNPNCQAKHNRKLLHFFQTINNLDGFGPKTIEILIQNKFDTIPKIYSMKYIDFQDCGYKHQTIMNLGTELEESKERELSDYRFIAALGIPDLGIGGAKKLLDHFNFEDILFEISRSEIEVIDGFGLNKSYSIINYCRDNRRLLLDICDINFNIIKEKIEVKESSITGKRICFTGKMSGNRKEMQKQAESLGAISVGSVNSKTDILVCGIKVGKNKTDAAKKFRTIIYSEQDYFDLIG